MLEMVREEIAELTQQVDTQGDALKVQHLQTSASGLQDLSVTQQEPRKRLPALKPAL
jgi:hypothetical protein